MATPTNTQIWSELIKLRDEQQNQAKRLDSLTLDVGDVRRRMVQYEQQADENNQLLKEIKPAIFFVKNSVRALKWSAILLITGLLGQVGIYLFHLITGR